MILGRRIAVQLVAFAVISLIAAAVMVGGYMQLPGRVLGVGEYTVTVELDQSGGLYRNGNVTYRGTEVGRVTDVRLTPRGVAVDLSLEADVPIPADLDAQVHSVSAAGEQYVALVPREPASSRSLKDGDVIPRERTSVPPEVSGLLDQANRGLLAIPRDDLLVAVDETNTALGGLGPELSRIVHSLTTLSGDAHANLGALTDLIERAPPVLDSQTATSDAIAAWADHTATALTQVRAEDDSVGGLLKDGSAAVDEARQLVDRLKPTLPLLLANLVTVGQVLLDYNANLEQMLVLFPQSMAVAQAGIVPDKDVPGPERGAPYLNFNLNFGIPPLCTTGFLPASQRRVPTFEDHPERPPGDLYCRVPQDSSWNVRGVRNIPCATVPGKRAPTAQMCESDQQYVPLNDGVNWKGDPNATLSGQPVPELLPLSEPPPPPLAVADYDPATGQYFGPDGKVYTRADLATPQRQDRSWESLILPPAG
ncbi:MCE family protein [Mycobacterium deserti]|uniref:MCE family protein n=1 Tax=Mycobacterium deserti TaxID=2978347 RepID=A0ABT2M6H9_9MYCO|nr:MlaD family protein [Mycobacterium deserti]MCT7657860.1 MCE family protein [Mycobacterium deserti]